MGKSITAEEKIIIDLFGKTSRYIIPSYQRSYSWTEKECSELWEDLKFVFETKENKEYFLGNIVLAKSNDRVEFEVVDGQQRLITLIIILHLLNLIKPNRDLEEAVWHIDRDNDEKSSRVTTRVYEANDSQNFIKILDFNNKEDILKIDLKDANQFEENTYFLYKQLKELDEKNIRPFRNFLLDKVYVLSIQSVDLTEEKAREKALVIFETINNRGLNLSDADIFKAQLYNSALNDSKQNDFIERWTNLTELAHTNNYTLLDAFRIYTHILRGKNRETGNEIGLRAFFSQDSSEEDYYKKEEERLNLIPLRKQNYIDVINDLNKIIILVDTFNQCIKNRYKEDNPYSKLSKWFQIIDEHTNNYPRFVIFVYLFYNSTIDKNQNLILNENQIDKLLLLSQNIIRYSYPHTSAMRIKFEIFKIIAKIANNEEYSFADKIEKLTKEDFIYFRAKDGRKKGFTLLAIYLDKKQEAISTYYFHTLITNNNKKKLNDTWHDKEYHINSIGNWLVTDIRRKTQALNQRVESYKKSRILDLQKLAPKLNDFFYNDFKEREERLSSRLVEFFSSDKVW